VYSLSLSLSLSHNLSHNLLFWNLINIFALLKKVLLNWSTSIKLYW
jgi:hypothetical protein